MKKRITAILAGILLFLLSFNTVAFADGYSFVNAPDSVNLGETVNFTVSNGVGDVDATTLKWEVSPVDSAIVKNGCVTFISAGEVKVKASNVGGSVEKSVTVSRTPYTEEGSLNFNFNTALSMNRFDANIVPDNTGVDAGNENWKNHWQLDTEKGYVERINDFAADVSKNVTTLYFKNTKMRYFDVTLIYQSVTGDAGWVGVTSNNTDVTKRGIDNGLISFVQSAGQPTFWGPVVGSSLKESSYPGTYSPTAWHALRVRLKQGVAEIYVDDLNNPVYTAATTGTPAEGNLGVMASGTGFRFKHIRASYIQPNGTKINYRKVDSLVVTQKPNTASVGQTIQLQTEISPSSATVATYTMTSSDSNVCIAKNGKLVFISQGEVTVSIISDDNPSIKEEWIIKVSGNAELGEEGSGSYYVNSKNTNGANVGMILTIVFAIITVGFVVACGIVLVKKKKR